MYIRSATLIVTSSVFGALAIAAVCLRFWAKRKRRVLFAADDYLIILGLILAIGLCICNIVGAACFRFGNHEIYNESGDLAGYPVAWLLLGYGKIFYVIQLLHTTAMPIIKASLMVFLYRIFGHVKAFRNGLWVIATYVFLWWFSTFWMSVFQCWPISYNWGTNPAQNGSCIPNYMTWYAWIALLNVFSDVALVLLPIPLVLRLQMPAARKTTTVGILTTAALVIVAGIGRTVGFFTYNHSSLDFTYVFYDFLIWTSIEPCLGVIGCSIPVFAPVVDIKLGALYERIASVFSRTSLSGSSSRQSSTTRADEQKEGIQLDKRSYSHLDSMERPLTTTSTLNEPQGDLHTNPSSRREQWV